MSEPVKNAEIEDVLSSIRRLVSEDQRKPAAARAVEPKAVPDRLVLTAALRVPEPPEEPEIADDDRPSDAHEASSGDDHGSAEETDQVEEDRHADHDHEDQASAPQETSETWDDSADQHDLEDAPEADAHHADADHDTHDEADTGHDHDEQGEDHDTAHHDHQDHDGHGQTDQDQDQYDHEHHQAEHEGPGDEDPRDDAPVWANPDATLFEAAGLADTGTDQPTPDQHADTQMDEGADVRPLGDKIAALEKVIAGTDDQWEPDDPGADDYAGTDVETLEWEDTESDAMAEPAQASEEVVVAGAADPVDAPEMSDDPTDADLGKDEALLDEEALRELVADIVREELQGALGERITRNVRKLVRREIHRALSIQDLE